MMTPDGCSFQYPFIMTDTTNGAGGLACYKSDSMVFVNGALSSLTFSIRAWRPYWTAIDELSDNESITIYPNPVAGKNVTIELNNNQASTIELYASSGSKLFTKSVTGLLTYYIEIPDIPPGLYFIKVTQNNFSQTSKLIKL